MYDSQKTKEDVKNLLYKACLHLGDLYKSITGTVKINDNCHHFHKSELLDAVSQKWLVKLDETLEAVYRKRKDPFLQVLEYK